MALHVVIGYTTTGPTSDAEPLYVGRDSDLAARARDTYAGARTLWLRNPRGLGKINADLAAARDVETRAAEAEILAAAMPADEPTVEARLAAAEALNRRLQRQLTEAATFTEVTSHVPDLGPVGELDLHSPIGSSSSEPVADVLPDAATGEEPAEAPADIVEEDPETATRRQAALAAADAAEAIESNPGQGKGKRAR